MCTHHCNGRCQANSVGRITSGEVQKTTVDAAKRHAKLHVPHNSGQRQPGWTCSLTHCPSLTAALRLRCCCLLLPRWHCGWGPRCQLARPWLVRATGLGRLLLQRGPPSLQSPLPGWVRAGPDTAACGAPVGMKGTWVGGGVGWGLRQARSAWLHSRCRNEMQHRAALQPGQPVQGRCALLCPADSNTCDAQQHLKTDAVPRSSSSPT